MDATALGLDSRLFLLINNGLESPFLDPLMAVATRLGEPLFLALFLLPALWILDRPHFRRNLLLFIAALTAAIVASEMVKYLLDTPRPLKGMKALIDGGTVHVHVLFHPKYDRGFPSGHATRIFSVAVLFLFFYKKTGWMLIAIGSLTALSRIYVGAHYPSDVLGGTVIGSAIGVIVYRFHIRRLKPTPSSTPDEINDRQNQ